MTTFGKKVIGYPTRMVGFLLAWPGNKLWELGARLNDGYHYTVMLVQWRPPASAVVTPPMRISAPQVATSAVPTPVAA